MTNATNHIARSAALAAVLLVIPALGFSSTSSAELVDDSVSVAAGSSAKVASGPASLTGVININEATEKQLDMLPGIGPSKARAIVMYRTKRPFKDPRHLVRVRGIGRGTLKQILPYLTVKGPTTLAQKK